MLLHSRRRVYVRPSRLRRRERHHVPPARAAAHAPTRSRSPAREMAHPERGMLSNMPESQELALFLSLPRAAREMGIGVERLKRAVRDGQVPAIEIGHRKVISRRVIERLAQVEVPA